MVTKGQKEIERRKNARKLILTFLKCIYDEFNNKCVFALLKNRNHSDYPVLQDLMGLSEDETFQFFLLSGLVNGNASYMRVNEKELKSLAMDSKIGYFSESYFLNRLRKLKAYYISFGSGQQKENRDPNYILLKTTEIIESSRITLQIDARKLLAGYTDTGTTQPLMSPALKTRCRKATTPIAFSPHVMQTQNNKRSNRNETPSEIKSVRNQKLFSPAYKLLLPPAVNTSSKETRPCKATTPVAFSPQVVAQRNYKRSNQNQNPAKSKSKSNPKSNHNPAEIQPKSSRNPAEIASKS
jgi:hypothetical protein